MLMLFACLVTFLLASSKEDKLVWDKEGGGLLVMVGSGSSVDRGPIFDKAAVMVAMKRGQLNQELKEKVTYRESSTGDQASL